MARRGSPTVAGLPQGFPTRRFFRAVQVHHELSKALLKFSDAHPLRLERDVEERASIPEDRTQESPLRLEPFVERRAWERGEDGDLNLRQAALADEFLCAFKRTSIILVESEDEAAIDGDAVRLDLANLRQAATALLLFPMPAVGLIECQRVNGLESDEQLRAAGLGQRFKELLIVGDREIGLREPADRILGQETSESDGPCS